MKFEDTSQNLRARLRVIQIIVILLLSALGLRLYVLQVVRGEFYAGIAENQRRRRLPIPAPRGVIYDRHGKILVDSRPIYNVLLSREDVRDKDLYSLISPLSEALGLDREILKDRFDQIKSLPAFESIPVKLDANQGDIAWVEAHRLEFPELRVELQPQRRYPANGVLAHALGYVGEISPEQLKQPSYKEKGLKPGDIIGQSGIEQIYDDYLRGRDGYREVLVDSRGRIQDEIETIPPQPGQDMITTIDYDLQQAAEDELRNSVTQRGVIIVMNPNDGEILALSSYPTFDPNLFSQRITTKEGRAEYAALLNDPETPLLNRAIQSRYPPGSTWKIPMAVAGLSQGAITVDHSNILCGGGITIGNKFTRCMGNHGTPDIKMAITKSCDGYFYRLGLKMGLEGIGQMVDEFDLNKRTGIDLPNEVSSRTPREFKATLDRRKQPWKEIDTVFASFGQVYEEMTPLSMLRTIAGIGLRGKLYIPHLLKEVKPAEAMGIWLARPGSTFKPLDSKKPNPKIVPIPPAISDAVRDGMWGVVNNGGTGAGIKMVGFDISGKTGTAQVVALGKDVGKNKDHSWFISYAPAEKPELAIVALIENSGFGNQHAAPASRHVYDAYYRKTRNEEPPDLQVAQAPKELETVKKPEVKAVKKPEVKTVKKSEAKTVKKSEVEAAKKPETEQ
jgi:penicillin-binding protein 2